MSFLVVPNCLIGLLFAIFFFFWVLFCAGRPFCFCSGLGRQGNPFNPGGGKIFLTGPKPEGGFGGKTLFPRGVWVGIFGGFGGGGWGFALWAGFGFPGSWGYWKFFGVKTAYSKVLMRSRASLTKKFFSLFIAFFGTSGSLQEGPIWSFPPGAPLGEIILVPGACCQKRGWPGSIL